MENYPHSPGKQLIVAINELCCGETFGNSNCFIGKDFDILFN